jgi:hypothetical protein
MSAEIVILLVGTALMLLAIVDSIKLGEKPLNLIHANVRIALGVLGLLLVIFGASTYGLTTPQTRLEQAEVGNVAKIEYPINKVQLISPMEGDSVKCRMLTKGVYPENHTKDIWVLLKPSDGKLYPQSDHTNTSFKQGGEWQVITRFGGDKNETFEVIVYETDSTASQFFTTTIQQWKDALDYPGLSLGEIPEGAVEIERINVLLKDDCRGIF